MAEPMVTVIMPIRQEEDAIGRSLASVLAQDWPADRLEVLVVDGRSTDRTREVVAEVAAASPVPVRLLDNPAGIVPSAMNIGLTEARGEVVVRVDGHCALAPDHLRRCTTMLAQTGAACAGGLLDTVGETDVARGIAAAQSHPLGVGPVAFRTGRPEAGPVDTLAFGAYQREVFDRVGPFDEELVRNQDDELNLRITQAGQTIWMDPTLRVEYSSRATLAGLWRQYREYGLWKVRVVQKHRGVASWRHLVPAAFVAGLAGAAVLALLGRRKPLAAALAAYGGAVGLATARATEVPRSARRWMPAAFATLHVGYGTGTWQGLWRWRRRWTDLAPAGQAAGVGEVERVDQAYRSYTSAREPGGRWDPTNPGNRLLLAERDLVLHQAALDHSIGVERLRVLEVGSGRGDVLAGLLTLGADPSRLQGTDVRAEAVREASARWPDLRFTVSAPDATGLADEAVDLVVLSTVFSSIGDLATARRLAADIRRTLAPGGCVVWYDLRLPNPANPDVRPHRATDVEELFPDLVADLRPAGLLPPLARRLGPATDALYPRLAVGPLRSHLLGVLRDPRPVAQPSG